MSEPREGWELTKENIQPLSSGRRMAYLAESLPIRTAGGLTDQHQYEEHHFTEVERLAQLAREQGESTEDPLHHWVVVIKYIEQHFPTMSPTINGKYVSLLKEIVAEFFHDERYCNDRRYIEVILKNSQKAPQTHQVRILHNFLENGYGTLVSEMYERIADLYQTIGDTKNACEVLRQGIQNKAQPLNLLETNLAHVQQVWAEGYAKSMQEGNDDGGKRSFASAVPTHGENNEAVPIRQFLQPAAPATSSKPKLNSERRIPIFAEDNGGKADSSINNMVDKMKLPSFNDNTQDTENRLEASKWNTQDAHLNNPVIPQPPEKLNLYVETDAASGTSVHQTVDKRVLKERKEIEDKVDGQEESIGISVDIKNKEILPIESKTLDNDNLRFNPLSRPKRNYDPSRGNGKDFFENIKYKPLPPGRTVNRVALKEDKWWDAWEERRREQKANVDLSEILELRKEVERLKIERQSLEKVADKLKLAEVKLEQKEAKIQKLENENEDLLNRLTRISTEKNVLESRLDRETAEYAYKLQEMQEKNSELMSELEKLKLQYDLVLQEKMQMQSKNVGSNCNDNMSSEFEELVVERRPVYLDVQNRNTEVYCENSSAEQGISSESSRFNSGDNTVAATTSFMPNLDDMSMSYANGAASVSNSLQPERRALALVEECGMMNVTPAGPRPDDIDEVPPPRFFTKKPNRRAFDLYESTTTDMSCSYRKPAPAPSRGASLFATRQTDFSSNQENAPPRFPPTSSRSEIVMNNDENAAPPNVSNFTNASSVEVEVSSRHQAIQENVVNTSSNVFVRPDIPSFKTPSVQYNENPASRSYNMYSNGNDSLPVSKPRARKSVSLRPRDGQFSDEEDEEDIILRRHQQTGLDLNISNLTCALMLGPKPLINSTPEHERTNRNLQALFAGDNARVVGNINAQLAMEEDEPDTENHESVRSLVSRYQSVLNDPPLNLSTIQETSRENRSRSRSASTTGSSSGNTMSSTRFGITGTTSTTPYYGNSTRSSSIPRSAVSQQSYNNNGYYSDTNAK